MISEMFKSAALLGLFTAFGTSALLWVDSVTHDRIADNERALMLTRLNEIVPAAEYDNDPTSDISTVTSPEALGSTDALTVYRVRQGDRPIAAILTTVAPDGYNGAIRLLVGIKMDGKIAGVRAIQHRETPGLGDKIETSRSNWILNFRDKHLSNPASTLWAVKRDGGAFDAFTGATITPRAVVKAVHKTLLYFEQNQDQLFAKEALPQATEAGK